LKYPFLAQGCILLQHKVISAKSFESQSVGISFTLPTNWTIFFVALSELPSATCVAIHKIDESLNSQLLNNLGILLSQVANVSNTNKSLAAILVPSDIVTIPLSSILLKKLSSLIVL
jgi:hypothetical protein